MRVPKVPVETQEIDQGLNRFDQGVVRKHILKSVYIKLGRLRLYIHKVMYNGKFCVDKVMYMESLGSKIESKMYYKLFKPYLKMYYTFGMKIENIHNLIYTRKFYIYIILCIYNFRYIGKNETGKTNKSLPYRKGIRNGGEAGKIWIWDKRNIQSWALYVNNGN